MPETLRPYFDNGYDLIPLTKPTDKGPSAGKRPLHAGWRKEACSKEMILQYRADGHGIGVRLSDTQLVVDVDPRNFKDGEDVLEKLEQDFGVKLQGRAPTVVTGGGGLHIYFRKPEGVPVIDSLPDYVGVEFKTLGRQVVAAGSTHQSGGLYKWEPLSHYLLQDAPEIPERLLNVIRRPPPRKVDGYGSLSIEEMCYCLKQLNPMNFRDQDRWLRLMMSCHHGTAGAGRYEFIEWSTSDPKYASDGLIIGRRWDSLTVERSGPTVTVATLFKFVLEAGGTLPKGRAEDEFDAIVDEDGTAEDDEETGVRAADRLLLHWNGKNCSVMEQGKFRIFSRVTDPFSGRTHWVSSARKDFEDNHCNLRIQLDGKLVPAAKWWIEHRKRLKYDGVVFDPERDHPGKLNLWEGWSVEAAKGDWSLFEKLIRETLCNGDEEMFEYTLNWCANLFQRPWEPAEVALAFRGVKGSGKGTFANALMRICYPHSISINSQEQLTSRFNAQFRDCILIFADEAIWGGDHRGESMLKAMITERFLTFEEKFKSPVGALNRIHLVIAGNAEWIVPAGMNQERRYAISETRSDLPSKKEFAAIHKQLYEEGGLEGFFFDMQRRDISNWHPRDNIPVTEALVDQKLRGLSSEDEFWLDLLRNGWLPSTDSSNWMTEPLRAPCDTLAECFREHLGLQGANRRSLSIRLGNLLKRWVPEARRLRVRAKPSDWAGKEDQDRAYFYELPPLEVCRERFEKELGKKVEWGVDASDENDEAESNYEVEETTGQGEVEFV